MMEDGMKKIVRLVPFHTAAEIFHLMKRNIIW
jgi:hypothetical protein